MSNNDPRELQDAQATIRDAFFDVESGLFTMNCVAGAGKSTTVHRVAAEDLIRRYVAGDRTPEQGVAVLTFNTDEAAAIGPAVCEHIREIVAHELIPEATTLTKADVENLVTRVRQAPFIGTVDSLLRKIFFEIVGELGFEETPTVGNAALLTRVHTKCYEAVATDPAHADAIAELEAAYPGEDGSDTPAEMLADAMTYCRDQRLTTAAFEARLRKSQGAAYPEGRTTSTEDIVTTIAEYTDADVAADTEAQLSADEWDHLVAADQRLYDAWTETLTTFCDVLETYREQYQSLIREYNVVSHTDVAFYVTSVFDGDVPADVDVSTTDQYADLRRRYRARLDSVIIDEAQDISTIQHDALTQFITSSMRVLACGDTLQNIYLWRHADPSIFASACREGQYLGIDWDTNKGVTATTTYRGTPDIAAGINTIIDPVFNDSTRGGLSDFEPAYPGLDAYRDPTDDPSIHVAAFTGGTKPASPHWVNPDGDTGEANKLAQYLASGIADGTLTDDTGEPQSITVVFRKRTRMEAYEHAFEDEGLTVQNASSRLFACNVVKAVLAVCEWLTAPTDQTRALLTDSPFDFEASHDCFEKADYDLDTILATDDLGATTRDIIAGLRDLRDTLGRFHRVPASVYLEDIIEQLGLRADPGDHFTETAPKQRVVALDALTNTVADWEADTQYAPAALIDLLEPFRTAPQNGPDIPSVTSDADVVFSTTHRMKGDQDGVIVLAAPGFKIWNNGPYSQRSILHGDVAALAPPTNVKTAPDITLPPFDGDLYTPSRVRSDEQDVFPRDIGLRWATEQWVDSDVNGDRVLLGSDHLQSVAAESRSEAWRLLYVALSRARDHLIIPLPDELPGASQPRDRWLDTIYEALAFSSEERSTYAIDGPPSTGADGLTIGVNDVNGLATATEDGTTVSMAGAVPPQRDCLQPWIPRFLNPSTAYPLTEDIHTNVVAHLLEESIHTDTDGANEQLPITFETLGPEAVGTCLHEALVTLIEMDVPTDEIEPESDPVHTALQHAIQHTTPCSLNEFPDSEREGLIKFFFESVVADFLESDLWAQIQVADTVYVDHELNGLVTTAAVEVELPGEADILINLGDGKWQISDLKIALNDSLDTTRPRYELQTAAYEYALQQEIDPTATIHTTIETFGCVRKSVHGQLPSTVIERRVRHLLSR